MGRGRESCRLNFRLAMDKIVVVGAEEEEEEILQRQTNLRGSQDLYLDRQSHQVQGLRDLPAETLPSFPSAVNNTLPKVY